MITVFGLGFVGLTTALGFAHFNKQVYGIDLNEYRLKQIREKESPFFEKHFTEELEKHVGKNLRVDVNAKEAVERSKYIFYCVGTPYSPDGSADLTSLFQALQETLQYVSRDSGKILIIKSTVPPSTTKERVIPFIEEHGFVVGKDVYVANNPEFLREGYCWEDFVYADRIVIGCEEQEAVTKLKELYKEFEAPIHNVSYNTGEFIKYLSNTMLATMISYSNEMSMIAHQIGDIEIGKAFKILHEDKRWKTNKMSSYVYPGCGYGGYCLPKDTNALLAISKEKGYVPAILENVIRINSQMPETITNSILESTNKSQKVGILGLAFKPESDDVRDCISAKVINNLLKAGYQEILAYDPVANKLFDSTYHYPLAYMESLEEIMKSSDVLIILTAWKEFEEVFQLKDKLVLDFRYMEH